MLHHALLKAAVGTLAASVLVPLQRSCQRHPLNESANSPPTTAVHASVTKRHEPIRMELLDANERPPMYVMRGEPRGPGRLVFLHGMCGHGLGYAQSFQFSASKYGTLIAPQGDVSCGGPWSKWSMNLEALDERITRTFRALGHGEPINDIVVMGYSQGASRAEALVRKWPQRYTRMVLMGGPSAPSARGLAELRAAVTMAGQRDRQDLMRNGSRTLSAIGVPATFFLIPEATHGAMGPAPERTMNDALSWLFENSRSTNAEAEPG
ncbi:MAG: alpha/beta hydrolase [Myxococcota bacterium]